MLHSLPRFAKFATTFCPCFATWLFAPGRAPAARLTRTRPRLFRGLQPALPAPPALHSLRHHVAWLGSFCDTSAVDVICALKRTRSPLRPEHAGQELWLAPIPPWPRHASAACCLARLPGVYLPSPPKSTRTHGGAALGEQPPPIAGRPHDGPSIIEPLLGPEAAKWAKAASPPIAQRPRSPKGARASGESPEAPLPGDR
jgi:hypothetical protein